MKLILTFLCFMSISLVLIFGGTYIKYLNSWYSEPAFIAGTVFGIVIGIISLVYLFFKLLNSY